MSSQKLYVPIYANLFLKHQEQYLKDFKQCGAKAVFLAVGLPIRKKDQEEQFHLRMDELLRVRVSPAGR